uniref:Secreted peptide n=1 Tax=Anopheles braziliensis TaxID=58242 RepID=A0A2M3YXZ5_9DIPT
MKTFLLGFCFVLASVNVAQALKCLDSTEVIIPSDGDKPKDNEKPLEYTECGFVNVGKSAAALLLLKPSTAVAPSTDYKCYHLRIEESDSKKATVIKGCIYKAQNVCDGKFKLDTVREVFCSQCDQDECNAAGRFISQWKTLSLTFLAIAFYFFK